MLLSEHHLPVISFTLNIVGPVKVFPLALRTFHEGIRLIETQCHAWKIPIIATYSTTSHAGHEYFWAVDGDARFIKENLCLLEDSVALGRLFDIDSDRRNENIPDRPGIFHPEMPYLQPGGICVQPCQDPFRKGAAGAGMPDHD